MLEQRRHYFAILASIVVSPLLAVTAAADSVADFYKGKTIVIEMGTGPGGSYDLYGRIIGQHLVDHIPGHPHVIIQHMPGHGGANAGNHIYNIAPQDGTYILLAHALPLVEKLEGGPGIRFKTREMQWLGAYHAIEQALALWHTAPANNVQDLKTADLVIGSFNKNHLTHQWAMLTKWVLGAKYKVVPGFRSGNDLNLAMERGEVSGWTVSWENIVGTRPQWLAEKKIKMLVQYTLERKKELADVPTLIELAPPEKRDVVEFIVAGTPIARSMAVGPKVPADRVAALRKAFADTINDPAFVADATKRKLEVHFRSAEEVTKLVDRITGASPELVARVKQAIR